MRNATFTVLAVAGLAAVAAQAMTRDSQPSNAGTAGWHMLREGVVAKLAYGLPDSDQLSLMLTCAPGDRAAVVYGDVQPRSPGLTLVDLEPQLIDPLSGGEAYEARLPLGDAALTRLARGGRMTVQTEAGDRQLTATPAERRMVEGFLSYCASGRA